MRNPGSSRLRHRPDHGRSQYQARQAIIQVMDEDLGPIKMGNLPIKFSRTPGEIRHTGRTEIGYDTVEILQSIGMNDEQIEELSKKGIIRKVDRKAAAGS